ncbi:putative membrane-associated, metal-dependent hydrolase [Xanthomonas hortorum ATCC 19865]|nr:putative membrane-associated, metal-dependent hydrolase [Xanthomonas hortorum ATCC 19865]
MGCRPKEQTHVPMVMWFSPEFARETCLRHRAGQYTDHDALFPSILGLMRVKTSVYARERDLFAQCAG